MFFTELRCLARLDGAKATAADQGHERELRLSRDLNTGWIMINCR